MVAYLSDIFIFIFLRDIVSIKVERDSGVKTKMNMCLHACTCLKITSWASSWLNSGSKKLLSSEWVITRQNHCLIHISLNINKVKNIILDNITTPPQHCTYTLYHMMIIENVNGNMENLRNASHCPSTGSFKSSITKINKNKDKSQ